MKLMRVGETGAEKPAILDQNGTIRDLSNIITDVSGEFLGADQLQKIADTDLNTLPQITPSTRIGPCVGQVGKFICIGLNYGDHAAEAGMDLPPEPIIFMKATSAICGPNDNIIIPPNSQKTDWEVELGIVIGKTASYVDEKNALEHVAGYCVINDISERAFQIEHSGQWVKGKSADTFGPIGPWLVTKEEIDNPQDLKMWLEVDGKRYQDGSTATMVFGVSFLVHYLSQFMSLQPGDIISTGTPPGVGMGQKPDPVYLKPNQTMKLGIEGLGEQNQTTKAWGEVD